MKEVKFITRKLVRAEPFILFVFGDNMAGTGFGGQAKEMRGEENSVGIPTKLLPSMEEGAFFRNTDFERAKPKIDAAFVRLFIHAAHGGEIYWPADGIGTGRAELKKRAPRIWDLIENGRIALLVMPTSA